MRRDAPRGPPAARGERRERFDPLARVEHRRERRQPVSGPGQQQCRGDRVAQQSGQRRGVQAPVRGRDGERDPRPGERADRVVEDIAEAGDAARFVELRELDRERERRRRERRRQRREQPAQAGGEQPGEAGTERQVQQHVRRDVAAGGAREGEPPEQLRRARAARACEAERIQRAVDDQERDDGEQPGRDAPVRVSHARSVPPAPLIRGARCA